MNSTLILSVATSIIWLVVYFALLGREDKQHKEYRYQLDMIIRAFKARDVIEFADTTPKDSIPTIQPNEYLPLESVDPETLLKKINENK